MSETMLRSLLLLCGVLSSLLCVGTDVLAALRFGKYQSFATQTISELMSPGAPTKVLVDPLFRSCVAQGGEATGARVSLARALHPIGS